MARTIMSNYLFGNYRYQSNTIGEENTTTSDNCYDYSKTPSSFITLSQQLEFQSGIESSTIKYIPLTKTTRSAPSFDVISSLMKFFRDSLPFSKSSLESLAENLCNNYGYNIYTSDLHEVFDDIFFQEYPSKNGYRLTHDFLSEVNLLKHKVSNYIDRIINQGKFESFLYVVDRHNHDLHSFSEYESEHDLLLLNKSCLSFAKSVYSTRVEYVNFLISEIIPSLIDTINKCKIIRQFNEFTMDSFNKDSFFIHITTVFERLFMFKVMSYWHSFCSINHELLSLFHHIDYSNPFIIASYPSQIGSVRIPNVKYPIAFTNANGLCISFIAIDNIDKIMNECKSDCFSKLNNIVTNDIKKFFDTADKFKTLRSLSRFIHKKLDVIIVEEFFKIMCSNWMIKITMLFRNLIVWTQSSEKGGLLEFVEKFFSFIFNEVKKDLDEATKIMIKSNNKDFEIRNSISGQCGFTLNEKFNKDLVSIRKKLFVGVREAAIVEFSKIIDREGVSKLKWSDNRKELLAIAIRSAKDIVNRAHMEVDNIVMEARVVSNDNTERKLRYAEACILSKKVIMSMNAKVRDVIRLLWNKMNEKGRVVVNSGENFSVLDYNYSKD